MRQEKVERAAPGCPADRANSTMYAEYLRLLRFRVIEIGDTADAQRLAATADLVVTGIRVHGPYDGVELIRHLREATDTRRMPVIVLTACAFESDQLRAQQAGCDLFLSCRNPACLTRWLVPFAASSHVLGNEKVHAAAACTISARSLLRTNAPRRVDGFGLGAAANSTVPSP